jgi:signal peptidase I
VAGDPNASPDATRDARPNGKRPRTLCFTAVITPIEKPPVPANRRALGCLLEIVETIVLTLILFWVIQSFVAQPFQVKQFSMQNTIEDGQYVLVDRLTPRFDPYHRGDIIVFTPPANAESPNREPFIKRVIGVAGDTVSIRDGKVLVNGIVLDEPYVFSVNGDPQATVPDSDPGPWTIAPGQLFVMGDHRARSSDSRVFGPIDVSSVIGRAWLRYWPLSTLSVLPTAQHPELASPSASPSAAPSTRPSASPRRASPGPTKRPTATPKP